DRWSCEDEGTQNGDAASNVRQRSHTISSRTLDASILVIHRILSSDEVDSNTPKKPLPQTG
ncbi:MAG: hypothetical protein AAGJ83_16240, partial [Planctomycetota bacterium]